MSLTKIFCTSYILLNIFVLNYFIYNINILLFLEISDEIKTSFTPFDRHIIANPRIFWQYVPGCYLYHLFYYNQHEVLFCLIIYQLILGCVVL